MTIARHYLTAISTSPARLIAQLRGLADRGACTDEAQSVRCLDPGPSGFDFSEDEARRVLRERSPS
jgi:hypothetical protein